MKKILLSLIFNASLAISIFAFDFGGSLSNKSKLLYPIANAPVTYNQISTVDLWTNIYFSTNAILTFSGNFAVNVNDVAGAYTDAKGKSVDATPGTVTPDIDIDTLQFYLSLPEAFGPQSRENLWIGRSVFRDFSGKVLNHKLDGVVSEFSIPSFTWRFGVGTSALLFKHSSGIFVSNGDRDDYSNPDVYLAAPRLIAISEFVFPKLALNQNLSFDLIGDIDLRGGVSAAGDLVKNTDLGGAVHQFFTGAKIDGKLVGSLFWDIYGYLQLGSALSKMTGTYAQTTIVAGLTGLDFNFFIPGAAKATLYWGILLGTGDNDSIANFPDQNISEIYTGFHAISKTGSGLIMSPQVNNLFQGSLGFSLKPLANMTLALDNFIFMRPSVSGMGEQNLIIGSTEQFIGFESDLSLKWRITTELGTNFSFGTFVPNEAALAESVQVKAQWELSLRF